VESLKEYYSVAVIGFSEEETSGIEELIQDIPLPVEVDYLENRTSSSDAFILSIPQEYDVVVLNSIGYTTPIVEIVSQLKQRYPLSEIILVLFDQAVPMIINSFRSGIRDVISYPLDRMELYGAIDRAISYRAIFQHSESVGKIMGMLTLWNNFRQFKSREDFYFFLGQSLREDFMANKIEIVHLNNTTHEMNSEWKSHLDEQIVNRKDVQDAVIKFDIEHASSVLEKFHWSKMSDGMLMGFLLHASEETNTWCVFSGSLFPKNVFLMDYIHHFVKVVRNSFFHHVSLEEKDRLSSLSKTDDVTGLLNQRALFGDIERLVEEGQERGTSFSILFLDIDRFKNVNDTMGHLIGTRILVELSTVLKKTVRESDYLYRYGGDEFVIIFPNAKGDDIFPVANRLLNNVRKHTFLKETDHEYKMTVSLGLAEYPYDASTKEEILELPDKMMYEAKRAGRDQLCYARDILKEDKEKE